MSQASNQPKIAYNYLGRTGLKVSEICLGAMTFGPTRFPMPTCDESTAFKIMDRFAELGGNFIDTADVYGPHNSENIVGNWLQKTGQRDNFVVATKFTVPHGSGPNQCGASRKNILFSVEGSLKRLKTSYIDLYYVHCWDSGTPLEETLSTLNDLVRCGKVRYIGCSNFTGWQLQKAIDISKYMGLEGFVALQQQYGLLERWSELEVLPVCQNEGVAFLPWGPLKGGWLTGRYKRGDKPADTSSSRVAAAEQSGWSATSWSGNDTEHTWNVLDAVKEVSTQTGKSMAAVSLRWVLQRPGIPSVIIGARTLEQLEDNMTATTFTLTKEQMDHLTKVSTRFVPYPYDFIAMFNRWRQRPSSN